VPYDARCTVEATGCPSDRDVGLRKASAFRSSTTRHVHGSVIAIRLTICPTSLDRGIPCVARVIKSPNRAVGRRIETFIIIRMDNYRASGRSALGYARSSARPSFIRRSTGGSSNGMLPPSRTDGGGGKEGGTHRATHRRSTWTRVRVRAVRDRPIGSPPSVRPAIESWNRYRPAPLVPPFPLSVSFCRAACFPYYSACSRGARDTSAASGRVRDVIRELYRVPVIQRRPYGPLLASTVSSGPGDRRSLTLVISGGGQGARSAHGCGLTPRPRSIVIDWDTGSRRFKRHAAVRAGTSRPFPLVNSPSSPRGTADAHAPPVPTPRPCRARRAEFREWEKRPRNLRVAPLRDRPLEPGKAECRHHSGGGWIGKDGRGGWTASRSQIAAEWA